LVRRPYDIGDRIAIADVENEANFNGAVTWFVQNVGLFTTTVCFAATNEVATLANGSLAASRIINGARSPKGVVHVFLKFGVNVPYSKVQVLKTTVKAFVKARPRKWVSLLMFRSTQVEADLGFIEYTLDLQHREMAKHG
jgi:small-conductance mechanosensitive channel